MTPDPTSWPPRPKGDISSLLVNAREAARLLGVCERTLWAMDIPRVRIGRNGVRYDVEDLKAWIAAQKFTPNRKSA